MLISPLEIARCYGSDCTTSAIKNVWNRNVRPAMKRVHDTLEVGGDPKYLPLMFEGSQGINSSSRYLCSYCVALLVSFFAWAIMFTFLVETI